MKKISTMYLGLFLILIGALLLVNQLDIWNIEWSIIYPVALLALAVLSFLSFLRGRKEHIFWTTVTGLLGSFFLLRNVGLMEHYWFEEYWPIYLLVFGFGFMVLYLVKPEDWGVLIPGVFLLFLGGVSMLHTLNVEWYIIEDIIDWWPILLVFVGAMMILSWFRQKKGEGEGE